MDLLKSWWVLVILMVLAILIILYVVGNKSVHAEVVIKAKPAQVWKVLTDFETIKEWNPVLIPLNGELKEGEKIRYEFRQDENNSTEMPATVQQITEEKLIHQSGGMAGVLTFNHQYQLEAVEGGTKVTIHEEYRGIMVPFWNPKPVEAAYGRLLKALKKRVEAG